MSLEHPPETTAQFYPVTWVCREDMLSCADAYAAAIEALDEAEVAYLAERFGEALDNFYWVALSETIAHHFDDKA